MTHLLFAGGSLSNSNSVCNRNEALEPFFLIWQFVVHICWTFLNNWQDSPFRLFGVADGEMGRSSDKRGACHPFQRIMRTNFLSRAIVRPLLQMTRYIFSPVSKWNYCTKLNHKSPRTTTLQFYSAIFDILMKLFIMRISKFRREG